jgi:hypothetical protein
MYRTPKKLGGSKLKNKILALSLLFILSTVMIISFAQPAAAVGQGQWITTYQIEDSTGQLLVQYDPTTNTTTTLSPVIPGTAIKVTFTVDVIVAGTGNLQLTTGLSKTGTNAQYWTLGSTDYNMGSSYNPNSQATQFTWTVGTFEMVLTGTVPSTLSGSTPLQVVGLYSASDDTNLDRISVLATSAGLATYNSIYSQQESKLKGYISSGVDQGFIDIYRKVMNASQALANAGQVQAATELLNDLNASNAPPSSTMQAIFLPLIIAMAVVAAIFAVLFLRIRGKVSYFQLVVEDQIKDLEGLTLRISKIDRASSSNLESVKERLKRLVGM